MNGNNNTQDSAALTPASLEVTRTSNEMTLFVHQSYRSGSLKPERFKAETIAGARKYCLIDRLLAAE